MFPQAVYAAPAANPTDWSNCLDPNTQVATLRCLEPVFARVVLFAGGASILAFFVMFCVAGFKYLTSGGDPKANESAKGTMTWAFIGMIAIGGAFIAINLLSAFIGQNLGIFVIPTPGP